jgi:hypothetical protein
LNQIDLVFFTSNCWTNDITMFLVCLFISSEKMRTQITRKTSAIRVCARHDLSGSSIFESAHIVCPRIFNATWSDAIRKTIRGFSNEARIEGQPPFKAWMSGLSLLSSTVASGLKQRRQAIPRKTLTSADWINRPIFRLLDLLALIPGLIFAVMVLMWHSISKRASKSPGLIQESDDESDQSGEYGLCDVVLADDRDGPFDLPLGKEWDGECEKEMEADGGGNGGDSTGSYWSPQLYRGYQ